MAASRTLPVEGSALRYTVAGDGAADPVVLLHPWFGCAAFWDRTAAGLADRRVYVLDLYSLGDGDWTGLEGPEGIARAVAALLEAEGLGRIALAGNSTGGIAAQILAAGQADRIAALVLVGTGASTGGLQPAYRAELDHWLAAGSDEDSAALVRRLLARDPEPAEMRRYVDAVQQASRAYMAASLQQTLGLDLRDRIGAITARTLVVRGELDAARTPEHVRVLLEGIPGSIAVEIPGAGHSPMVDSAERFVPLVRAFLDGEPLPGV
jgi:3-oxoadipate enol-lactonase